MTIISIFGYSPDVPAPSTDGVAQRAGTGWSDPVGLDVLGTDLANADTCSDRRRTDREPFALPSRIAYRAVSSETALKLRGRPRSPRACLRDRVGCPSVGPLGLQVRTGERSR